jgi:hypothetical protein
MFKKLFSKPATAPDPSILTSTVVIPTTAPSNYVYSSIGTAVAGNITAANPSPSQYTINAGMGSVLGGMFQQSPPTSIISFSSIGTSQEIVKLKLDGSVEWANGIKIDEAAEAFARSLTLGAEQKAGLTRRVKLEMRDSVFNDLIHIAKEKGSLTAEDLTYLLEASKIVEKLKGGN